MELLSLPSSRRTNQTNGTMIDLQNIPNGKCIADMRCSSRHATAKIAQTRDYSSGHKSTDKLGTGSQKHLLLQNLVQLRMFAGAERAPPAAEA